MNLAFDKGLQLFAFPKVLDAVDVIDNPDELSIMTYVSYYRAYLMANTAYGPIVTLKVLVSLKEQPTSLPLSLSLVLTKKVNVPNEEVHESRLS